MASKIRVLLSSLYERLSGAALLLTGAPALVPVRIRRKRHDISR